MTKNLQILVFKKSIKMKKVHIRIQDGGENFGIKQSVYITILSEHYMPMFII